MAGAGDDDHASVHAQHVDVMAVEPAEHIGADDLRDRAAGRASGGQIDDPVHRRQEGIHLVGGDQNRDLLLGSDAPEQRHHLLGAAEVEVGQRLVEEQEAGPVDQGMGNQNPLLLTARELAHPGISEGARANRVEHLLDAAAAGG